MLDVLLCIHSVIVSLVRTEGKLHQDGNSVLFITGSPEPKTARHIAGANLKRFSEQMNGHLDQITSSPASEANPLLVLRQAVSLHFSQVCGAGGGRVPSSLRVAYAMPPAESRTPGSRGSKHHTSGLCFHLTPSLIDWLSQHH